MATRLNPITSERSALECGRSLPQESHGRWLTATSDASHYYRTAQERHRDKLPLIAALRLAVEADPTFAVAATDLAALDRGQPAREGHPHQSWERHHVEVVRVAADGNARRALDLLREHLTVVACDPIATAVVLGAATDESVRDILDRLPPCHSHCEA
jgi:hypothetical protein